MAFYGNLGSASSQHFTSKEDAVYKLANHLRPFLGLYINPNPSGTKADPKVVSTEHKWPEKKLKCVRDNLYAALDNSATTVYTKHEKVRYIAGKSIVKVDDEYMAVTEASYATDKWTLTVTRGFNSSTAAAHKIDADVLIVNMHAEGGDADRSDADFGTENSNYTQIIRRELSMSDTSQAIKAYGDELKIGTQLLEKFPEMFQELENALVHGTKYSSGANRLAGGMSYFVDSDMVFDSGSNKFSLRTLDEDISELIRNGVNPEDLEIAMGTKVRQSLADKKAFATQDATSNKKLDYNYQSIITPQGYEIKVPPTTPVFNPNEYYLYPKKSIKVKFLRALDVSDLAKLGSSTRKMAEMEFTIECLGWALGGALRRKGIN